MFVGVAGGLREWTEVGDVVVATRVYAYHGGRTEGDEHLVRPRVWDLAHDVEQPARTLTRSFAWRESLPDRPLRINAAGEVVHNSTDSAAAHRDGWHPIAARNAAAFPASLDPTGGTR